jgi:hypothetical protein
MHDFGFAANPSLLMVRLVDMVAVLRERMALSDLLVSRIDMQRCIRSTTGQKEGGSQ